MNYSLGHIAGIIGAPSVQDERPIRYLLLDSRKLYSAPDSLFFALKASRRNGHQFIQELYKKGVRCFVVSEKPDLIAYPAAQFLIVPDTLAALQTLAAQHRANFTIPVIGITGSNGKTITKEWLYQLLVDKFTIVRSPKSYNSQIGVPLSVWQLNEQDTLGIFEAGISQPAEMSRLEAIIKPTIGILTNIGDAHNEGFRSKEEKLNEKLQLFQHSQLVIGRDVELASLKKEHASDRLIMTWGTDASNDLQVKHIGRGEESTSIGLCFGSVEREINIPFTDDASIENAITCYLAAIQLGLTHEDIAGKMANLHSVNMRLEVKKGINNCTIINDSYSADLHSLEIALNFLDQQSHGSRKTLIVSDLLESGETDERLYSMILEQCRKHQVGRLIGIGEKIAAALRIVHADLHTGISIELFSSTDMYLRQFLSSQFKEETILAKGARVFEFEKIVQLLEQKVHQTVLEINLNAIVHNVKVYQHQLSPATKIMAMVKAFAYGSGGAEIAGILQYHNIDYLGVAYSDEGVELRRSGVDLPIMVMNPEETAFESIVEHRLEPDIYSFELLYSFESFLQKEGLQGYPIHIEIETGMNRLGFALTDIARLADHLGRSSLLKVQTVFTHLAGSEDPAEDAYTLQQFDRYQEAVAQLKSALDYPFIRHVANTAAIFRFPALHLDMVRLGIGLYGIDSALSQQAMLQPAASLKTTIAQIKQLKAGEAVSYNRKGLLTRDSVIATVRIGYADGYSRRLGNGVGKILVAGQLAPVVGTICMDMTMIDITDIADVSEGDEVIVFGKELTIQRLAEWAGTIPYEIMTGISQRVKRVYFEE